MGHYDVFQSAKSVRRSRPELVRFVHASLQGTFTCDVARDVYMRRCKRPLHAALQGRMDDRRMS